MKTIKSLINTIINGYKKFEAWMDNAQAEMLKYDVANPWNLAIY